jgi:hypothetical protein
MRVMSYAFGSKPKAVAQPAEEALVFWRLH